MKKEDKLYKLIFATQKGQGAGRKKESMVILLEKFKPLISKYTYLLYYEDAEDDLVLFFIEMIQSIQLKGFKLSNSDYQLLAFISKAMHNEFIKLSKAKDKKVQTLELEEWYCKEQPYNDYVKLEVMELLSHLKMREKQIIIMKYWFGYSDIEVGGKLNITRQTVNRINKRSLDKMHRYIYAYSIF